ncbi:hypothetical protein F5888DRAFT_753379 [Russula emetica]|nr:hypothetical protein F5888DRAFT_753379 [Russula emetica]
MQVLGVTHDSPGYRFDPLLPSPMSSFNPNPSAGANSSSKSPQMEKSMQGKGVNTKDTYRSKPHIPVFDSNPSGSAISSSKSPRTEKSVKIGPPRIGKPGTSSIKQHSPSRSDPPRSGNGTLANLRALEALVRLDELRRAGKRIGNIAVAKRHPTLETSQNSEQPPPHLVFKRVMDGMKSPNGGNHRADPSKSQEGLVINKSGQDASIGSLSRTGVLAANVLVPSSEDEVPPTASNSTQSQSHDALPHTSLDSQLAAALDLLHKKSEEISELRIQVNILRVRSTEQASNGALHGKEATDHLATGVQTDRDSDAYKDWNLERTRWSEEKLALQGEGEALRGEKERALADVDFFRTQYQRASDFASSTRNENEELSARAALAESQATKGVALVRATFDGRVVKLEAEIQKYKALSEMLTERARRTDDDVRYRAALAPEFEREYRQLEGRFSELEAEFEETKDELFEEKRANSKLRRQVARLESKEQGVNVGQSNEQEQDHMLWSDEKDDGDYNPTRGPSSSPRGGSDGSSLQPQRQEDHSPHNEDDAGPADGEIEQLDSFGLGESTQSSNDDMVYLCRWRPGEPAGNCDAVVGTKEELHEHVLSHHLACH